MKPCWMLRAGGAASAIASDLAVPGMALPGQSLARGSAGVAVLHAERARADLGSWKDAHSWLAWSAAGELDGSLRSSLFYGVPAVAAARQRPVRSRARDPGSGRCRDRSASS